MTAIPIWELLDHFAVLFCANLRKKRENARVLPPQAVPTNSEVAHRRHGAHNLEGRKKLYRAEALLYLARLRASGLLCVCGSSGRRCGADRL